MTFCVSNPNNRHYRYAIKREIQIESKAGTVKELSSFEHHPIITFYTNEEITGEKIKGEFSWYDIFLNKFKPVEDGLSLGTGTGRHQKYLTSRGYVKKWDSIDLLIHDKSIMGESLKGMKLIANDLNFIDLPADRYPLIFCHGVLHHIINLEHLLIQINRALKKNGIFILSEYVGEKKQQWQDEKIELINKALSKQFRIKYPFLDLEIRKQKILNKRPLESIRSDEIPDLVNKVFGSKTEFEYLGLPVLYPIVNHLSRFNRKVIINNPDLLDEILGFAVQLDKEIKKNNPDIKPTLQMGVYQKTDINQLRCENPWTSREIKANLSSHEPLWTRIKNRLYHYKIIRTIHTFLKKNM